MLTHLYLVVMRSESISSSSLGLSMADITGQVFDGNEAENAAVMLIGVGATYVGIVQGSSIGNRRPYKSSERMGGE